jgi:5-methylcytosine-specific restriction enzyme A
MTYYEINLTEADQRRIKKERETARLLKKTHWWQNQLNKGICHHCGKKFQKADLTLDHLVPLARGGKSTKGNMVPSCKSCNAAKKLDTPVDRILAQMELK